MPTPSRTATILAGLVLCAGAAFAQSSVATGTAARTTAQPTAVAPKEQPAPPRLEEVLFPKGLPTPDATLVASIDGDVVSVRLRGKGLDEQSWTILLTNTHRLAGSTKQVSLLATEGLILSDKGDARKAALLLATNTTTGVVMGPIFILPFLPIDPYAVPGIVTDKRCHALCADQYFDDTQILDQLSEEIESQRAFLDFLYFACNLGHRDACDQIPLEQERLNDMVQRWLEVHDEHFTRYAKCLLRCWFIMAE